MKNREYFLIAIVLLLGLQSACVKNTDMLPQQAKDSRPLLTVLKNNYAFSMFYGAVQRTGLDKTLNGNGPYTLLVPDNDAFAASGISADSLAKIDTATLKKLLLYHIIPASLPYSAIPTTVDFKYKTMAGPMVYFSVPIPGDQQFQSLTNKIVHINGVTVNKTDIAASNGTIYDLAKVLNYPAASVKSYLEGSPQYSLFTQALKQFGLFDQLDKPGPFMIMAPSNDVLMQNGIDKTTLAGLDTVHYKKTLFNPYVVSPYLFFISDVLDAPLNPTTTPGIVTPDFVLITFGSTYMPPTYGIKPLNFRDIEAAGYVPPYYGNSYIYQQPVNITDPNHLAVNGVIHGIDGLVILPDSAQIH